MTETAVVVDNILAQEKREKGTTVAPSSEATLLGFGQNTSAELLLSSSKRRCMHPKIQSNGDLVLNEGNQPGSNLSFNVNNFVSEVKITVSDYISQQYLVRGSPNYKVLKDKIREYCLSMKPTGMKDDASCRVLYLVYKSLPELKRTDEADSIIRKMIGKHIRNAKYRAKCKLRECKMTEAEKGSTIAHKNDSQEKANYLPEGLLNPNLLVMLHSEAYKLKDPFRNEILQTSVRDSQNIRSNLANAIKSPTLSPGDDYSRKVSYGGHCSLAHLNNNDVNNNNNINEQSAFSNILTPQITASSSLHVSDAMVTTGWVTNSNGFGNTEKPPVYTVANRSPGINHVVEIKQEPTPSQNGDNLFRTNGPRAMSPDCPPANPETTKPSLMINATRRAEQSPKQALPPPPPSLNTLPELNEVCEHRLKFITGLTYACFICNDYFERVPAVRLPCTHCKKVFSHRHLLLQHNNEAHAFENATG
ncbi:uncharacterized protein LOC134819338 [Bolinopsis microptera]|uniref:uncharacterized protein LOC134819338 n=1 Tax=Bolinopsis microptera TaxID=2820187 RepID=UPI00307A5383